MQDRGSRKSSDRRLTAGSSSSDRLTPTPEFAGHAFLSPNPDTKPTPRRPTSPLDLDPSSTATLGISSSTGPDRIRSASSSGSRPGPSAATMSAGKASPPYAKKKKDDKPTGKDQRKSCAECRRLKAKCDRVFPCSNCRRRGCALVCPDGDLGCMQGKRLVLASTEQLHERIAQLETALFQANKQTSDGPHPLLAAEFLDGGFASQPPPSTTTRQVSDPLAHTGDRLEGLVLSDELAHGSDVDFVGGAASLGGFLPADFRPDTAPRTTAMDRLRSIMDVLPTREKAREMANRFFLEAEWFNFVILREEYDTLYEPSVFAPTAQNPLSMHKLACVLMVCALQLYLDPARDFDSVDGKVAVYWDAAQQCFDTRCGWAATVPGVQALALMTWFVHFTTKTGGGTGSGTTALYWLRRMTAACQELELNKEPPRNLPMAEANFRRRVFWEATALDCVVSPSFEHYTGIPIEQVKVTYPTDTQNWSFVRYEFIRTVSLPAIDLGLRADTEAPTAGEISGLEELLSHYAPEAQPALHCPYLVGEMLPDLNPSPLFDTNCIQRSTISMTLYQSFLCVYKPSLRRIVELIRTNRDIELSPWDRHIVMRSFETSQKIIRLSHYVHRIMPRIAGRYTAMWAKLSTATAAIAAAAIWCGPHMSPSFVGQVVVELQNIARIADEATAFNASSDRPQAVRELVAVFQSMVVGRYPQVVGEDPTRVTASIAREDMLFAMLGGSVDGVRGSGVRDSLDWSAAFAAAPGMPQSTSTVWAQPQLTPMFSPPRRDISPALLHTPGHEGVPGTASSFGSTSSPFAFGGGSGYFDSAMGQHQISPPNVSGPAHGVMSQPLFVAEPTMMEPPQTAGGAEREELWKHIQPVYTPIQWWSLSSDAAPGEQQYMSSSASNASAPASLNTSMGMDMLGSRPTSSPYPAARMASLSPTPPIPRVMSVSAAVPMPHLHPHSAMHEAEMPPPPMFHGSR